MQPFKANRMFLPRYVLPLLVFVEIWMIFFLAILLPRQEAILGGVALSAFIFFVFVLRPLQGFAILVAGITLTGFTLVWAAWRKPLLLSAEIQWIAGQLALSVLCTSLWLQALFVKQLFKAYKTTEEELNKLKKADETTGVLTANEFFYRLEDVVVGMHRRGERGYLLIVTVTAPKPYLLKSILPLLGQLAVQSVRSKYDLVGRLNPHQLAIALQNTDETGVNVVQERLHSAIEQRLSSHEELLQIRRIALEGAWPETLRVLLENELGADIVLQGAQRA